MAFHTNGYSRSFTGNNVVSGTHGYIMWNNKYVAETSAGTAELDFDREDMQFAGEMVKDSKLMSLGGKFTVKIRKVYDRARELAESVRKGEDPRIILIMAVKDPDAKGNTSITLKDCWFDSLSLLDFETGKISEEEYTGGFSDFSYNDSISVPS